MDDLHNNLGAEGSELQELAQKALTFYVGSTLYGLPLTHVLEIINMQPIAKVPGTPGYVKGIINLRGGIVPVVDIRLKFGQEERAYDDATSIIVTLLNSMMVGIIVDRVSNVVNLEELEVSTLPEFNNVNTNRYMTSVSRLGNELLMNLDCETILEDDNILNIG